jgi:predicted metallo-beta-lactamase superfamily hydrolase
VEQADLERGLANLQRIVSLVPVVVLEHHALRDEVWRPKLEAVFEAAESVGHQVVTAAEFAGQENRFLESHRRQLFHDYPVSDEFKAWTKTLTAKTISKPPI